MSSVNENDEVSGSGHVYPREMPLPSYDEVVGNVPMKTDVLLGEHCGNVNGRRRVASTTTSHGIVNNDESFYVPRTCQKGFLVVLVALILAPLFVMVIVIQAQVCTVSPQELDDLYKQCVNDRNNLLQQLNDPVGTRYQSKENRDTLKLKLDELLLAARQEQLDNANDALTTTTRIVDEMHKVKPEITMELLEKLRTMSNNPAMNIDETMKMIEDIKNTPTSLWKT